MRAGVQTALATNTPESSPLRPAGVLWLAAVGNYQELLGGVRSLNFGAPFTFNTTDSRASKRFSAYSQCSGDG